LYFTRSSKCENIFTGIYKVESFDENLEAFLDSLGLSGEEFGPIVRSAQVHIAVRQPHPRGPDKCWTLTQFHSGKKVEKPNIRRCTRLKIRRGGRGRVKFFVKIPGEGYCFLGKTQGGTPFWVLCPVSSPLTPLGLLVCIYDTY
jgi:hypothetical protein